MYISRVASRTPKGLYAKKDEIFIGIALSERIRYSTMDEKERILILDDLRSGKVKKGSAVYLFVIDLVTLDGYCLLRDAATSTATSTAAITDQSQ